MCRILVIYHSQTGNTEKMAREVARGADAVDGVSATLLSASAAGIEDLLACDGIVIGSPEYFGYMAGMVKDFFDRTYEPARGRREVFRKPYGVFISAGNDGSGALRSIERICLGYPFKKVLEPLVAVGCVDESVLSRCRELGMTIAAGCEAGIY
ncbi:MAG: flavodoxin family protein [Deltaproteobacteria bacterium]|nr:flavodoxin family protein [Deltaproteobacteria bacterium]MBW1922813.1 flavodoxin family protein [Deltaproteobacteria bacterium]MBW1948204.1 flavodoxin family protein [Deltaproteobacteria bacterium]MBW2006550.1 flavodoxin family protein [Deltaproteobacteria bacterium]MBW2101326.1 flavodoxin family protein [Deltaproteobacteria bacterium]